MIDKSLIEYEVEWPKNYRNTFKLTEVSYVKMPDDVRLSMLESSKKQKTKYKKREDKKNG